MVYNEPMNGYGEQMNGYGEQMNRYGELMSRHTSMKVGGPATVFVEADSEDEFLPRVQAFERAGLTIKDMDLVEANEAFAVQAKCVLNELGLNPDVVNVNGGAIALGHPIGASGARVLVTLIHEMLKRKSRYGLATLCVGGGQGISMIVEREG